MGKNKSKSKKPIKKSAVKPKAKTKALKKPAKVAKSQAKAKEKTKVAAKAVTAKPASKAATKPVLTIVKEVVVEEVVKEVVLTNADGKRYCKVTDCDEIEAIDSYCRLHYIMYWKRNKTKGKILEGGKLDKYIEELTNRYPDKYLEMLKKDLATEKDFNGIIAEMDAEEAADDVESEEDDNRFIEEVRGTVPTDTGGGDDESF